MEISWSAAGTIESKRYTFKEEKNSPIAFSEEWKKGRISIVMSFPEKYPIGRLCKEVDQLILAQGSISIPLQNARQPKVFKRFWWV